MSIGSRIKKVRECEGQTQKEFADSIKIGQSTLAMFENGQREPKDIHIEQISSKYGVRSDWLLTGEGEMYELIEDETAAIVSDLLEEENPLYDIILQIAKTYQQLDDKSQAVLLNFSRDLLENLKKEG